MTRRGEATFPAPSPRSTVPDWYATLLEAVAEQIGSGRQAAVTAVNQQLVHTYWSICREILGRQHQQGWGTGVIDRLAIDDQDFYCDLLFYHLRLRAYVVIELKAGKFEPGYLGQLGMYMAAVDDLLAHPQDNPTIGLLLCKSKSDVVAEYALRGYNAPIGVAEWATAIAQGLPQELSSSLPSIADLEAELAAVEPDPRGTG